LSDGPSSHASLALGSVEWSAAEIISAIGVIPDSHWEKGEVLEGRGRRGNSGVRYESGLRSSAPLNDHIAAVVERLIPVQQTLAALLKSAGPVYGYFSLSCEIATQDWIHDFLPEHAGFAAALGVPLSLHLRMKIRR
jgi:hypothetical protein